MTSVPIKRVLYPMFSYHSILARLPLTLNPKPPQYPWPLSRVIRRGIQPQGFSRGRRPLEGPGGPGASWNGLEAPGNPPHAWMKLMYGVRVLGTLNWDLRWVMTRALLRDMRSFSYRSAARPKYTFRLLVKWLWTPEGFQAPNPIH